MKHLKSKLLLSAALTTFTIGLAQAQQARFDDLIGRTPDGVFDCSTFGVDTLKIYRGTVLPIISGTWVLKCPTIVFVDLTLNETSRAQQFVQQARPTNVVLAGDKLPHILSSNPMEMRAVLVKGAGDILGISPVRATAAENKPTSTAQGASGFAGGAGGNGRNSRCRITLRGVKKWSSSRGGNGNSGTPGTSGRVGIPGAHGSHGAAGVRTDFIIKSFSDDGSILIVSPGRPGSDGAIGGVGEAGGHGGPGGNGGKGGNASSCHRASGGGSGGRGGNGGNGGNGGPGGNGGNGGDGGNVTANIRLEDRDRITIKNPGGRGGQHGAGGSPGMGGLAGPGGSAGCGGGGSRHLLGNHGPGGCGQHGSNGAAGSTGRVGKLGVDGKPGKPGQRSVPKIKTFVPEILQQMFDAV